MKYEKIISIISFLLFCSLILTACGSAKKSNSNGNKQKDFVNNQQIILNTMSEPPSLDPALIDNQLAGDMANQLFEGLVRLDKDGNVKPGVAERWTISDDQLVYTFYLNKNDKWSNGESIGTKDFIYSWEKALRPETAAPLGSNLFFIKNGMEFNRGEITDPSKLGLKALDDYTFEVTLEKPTYC